MVVAVGLTLFVPVAALEVKLPGVMAMLVAPVTAQLKVLLPDEMLVGSAEKEAIAGAEPFGAGGVVEPQPVSPTKINPISRICDHRNSAEEWSPRVSRSWLVVCGGLGVALCGSRVVSAQRRSHAGRRGVAVRPYFRQRKNIPRAIVAAARHVSGSLNQLG